MRQQLILQLNQERRHQKMAHSVHGMGETLAIDMHTSLIKFRTS